MCDSLISEILFFILAGQPPLFVKMCKEIQQVNIEKKKKKIPTFLCFVYIEVCIYVYVCIDNTA